MASTSTGLTNIFAPESTPAQMMFDYSMYVLGLTGLIFVIVSGLLVYAVIKCRVGPADADADHGPAQVYGSTQIELAWTVVPVLFLVTARVIHGVQDTPKPPNAFEVTAIGHQLCDRRRQGLRFCWQLPACCRVYPFLPGRHFVVAYAD